MLLVGLLPFNGLKALIVGVSTYLLYKKVSLAIFKVDYYKTIRKIIKSRLHKNLVGSL